jgi:hypothetical protein
MKLNGHFKNSAYIREIKMLLARIHFWFGFVGIIVFLLTGLYMDQVHNHLQDMADRSRMFYRSAHIYLLLAALLNLFLGVYLQINERTLIKVFQYSISSIVLLCPVLFLLGFYFEYQHALVGFERPYSRAGSYLILFASGLLCLQVFFMKK